MPRSLVPAIVVAVGLEHREADLHVEIGTDAIERLGARRLGGDVRRSERRRQRRREVGDEADEGLEQRLARGAGAVREQQARGDLRELAGRVGGERLPRQFGIAPAEPAQRPAETRVQSCGERAGARSGAPAAA